jgi:hypothetical protein
VIERILSEIEKTVRRSEDDGNNVAGILDGTVPHGMLIFFSSINGGVHGRTYSCREQFCDCEKMLFSQLEDMLLIGRACSGSPLCVRPDYGTVALPAMTGCEYRLFENQHPWLTSHLTREQIENFDPGAIDSSPMMRQVLETAEYMRGILPGYVHVYLSDTQGPFSLAHLVYGDGIFYDLHDDPDFVHRLMRLCTDVYIRATRKIKQAIGEPLGMCYHGHASARGIRMRNGGARISEDTATMLSGEHIREYVIPYSREAFAPFGGGFAHFCGKSAALLASCLSMGEIKAVNLGNPEMYDFDDLMVRFDKGKAVYFGHFPAMPGERLAEYLRRMKYTPLGRERRILLRYDEQLFGASEGEVQNLWERVVA